MSKKHIVLTRGDAINPNTLTREQKFVGGFVSNVHPDNIVLMRRAAKQLQIKIIEGEPRKSAGTELYIGIYTDISQHDPQALLQQFFTLLIARSNKRQAQKGDTNHGHPTSHPRRRRDSVKTTPRKQQ